MNKESFTEFILEEIYNAKSQLSKDDFNELLDDIEQEISKL